LKRRGKGRDRKKQKRGKYSYTNGGAVTSQASTNLERKHRKKKERVGATLFNRRGEEWQSNHFIAKRVEVGSLPYKCVRVVKKKRYSEQQSYLNSGGVKEGRESNSAAYISPPRLVLTKKKNRRRCFLLPGVERKTFTLESIG